MSQIFRNHLFKLVLLFCFLLVPLTGEYNTILANEILIMGLFAMSFNILYGYTGLLSFGQAAYFGIGAYVTGLALLHWTDSFLVAFSLGVLSAAIASAVIGFFCVRLTRIYFAMLTLAFAQMVFAVSFEWRSVTGGDDGLVGIPRASFFMLDMYNFKNYYYFTLIVVSICVLAIGRIVESPLGRVLVGIRENDERVEFLGVPVRRYRLIAFVISGIFAGLSGCLMASFLGIVSPDLVHWSRSADPLLMTLVGGIYNFWGPLLGAAIFQLVQHLVIDITGHWMFFFGWILVFIVIFLPNGIAGFVVNISRKFGIRKVNESS